MPTKKQLEANRSNAGRSAGPVSVSGKARACRNAFRHGLSRPDSSSGFLAKVEKHARSLASSCENAIAAEFAAADLELARVRRAKVALIESVSAFGALAPPKHFCTMWQEVRWCQQMDRWFRKLRPTPPPHPAVIHPLDSMPVEEPDRLAEAARRVLPELLRLMRYENRAASRRDRAIRAMLKAKMKNP